MRAPAGGADAACFAAFAAQRFGALLVRWNRLDAAGFAGWDFLDGMRFGERAAWWRGGADRGAPHEGLDLRYYRTGRGARLALCPGARVPVVLPGRVVSVVTDFLGCSLFVEHDLLDRRRRRLHSVLGHITPGCGLEAGSWVQADDEAGTIAEPAGRPGAVPPHLHVTIAMIDRDGGPARLDWDAMRDRDRVLLLDPLPLIGMA